MLLTEAAAACSVVKKSPIDLRDEDTRMLVQGLLFADLPMPDNKCSGPRRFSQKASTIYRSRPHGNMIFSRCLILSTALFFRLVARSAASCSHQSVAHAALLPSRSDDALITQNNASSLRAPGYVHQAVDSHLARFHSLHSSTWAFSDELPLQLSNEVHLMPAGAIGGQMGRPT